MKILVKPIAILLLGAYSFALGQDVYPYFSDPNKQTKFEDEKVYIIEKSGKEQHFSGGDSYTELANTWGYILLDEDPDYVVKQTPITTYYEYYYEFKIKQGAKELTELEFLLTAGYDAKAKEIYDKYEKKMSLYNTQYATYEKELKNYLENNKKIEKVRLVYYKGNRLFYSFAFIGVLGTISFFTEINRRVNYKQADTYKAFGVMLFGILGGITSFIVIPTEEKFEEDTMSKPSPPSEPRIEQVLSNEQIKSLAESYNRRIYEEIKNAN